MSTQVTTAHVEQYRANVYHLVQQKGSRLRSAVRNETQVGKNAFYEQIGATQAQRRTSRHADTPRMDTPHARRRVSLEDWEWADLIDEQDRIRMLVDPSSPYATAAMYAMGRSMDDVIIAAADGTAYTGESGSTQTAFDASMVVDVQTVWPGVSAADTGLNVAKILRAKRNLLENSVDPDEEMFMVVNARQAESLMKDERVANADYNSIKPLVEGNIAKYGGFTMIPTERIGLDANGDDKVLYWTKSGMLLSIGKDMKTRVTERDDKGYATQVYCCMSIGATRMEEERVGYIECDPGASPTTDA
jgi:hypothetical protein